MTLQTPQTMPRDKRENLNILVATSFLRGAHTSIYNVIWQPFVLWLGASMPTLGLLNSLGGLNGIVTTLAQPLGGWLADRVGRKPFLIAASIVLIAAYALFAFAGLLNVWTLLILGVILFGASALALPARSSMTAESVREGQHGSAFSLIMLATIVPGIVAPTLGGALADRWGFVSIFPISIALEALALFLVWRFLRETRASNGDSIRWRDAARVIARAIVPPKGLRGFFIACACDSFAWGMGWMLLYGMLSKTYQFSTEQLGIMASISSLSWAISQMPIGRYIDKHGTRGMLIFSEVLGIPLMLVGMTQSRFEIFAAASILFGLTAATWVPTIQTYLSRRVSADERAEAFGRLSMFRGVIGFPAPAIGGWLFEWGGMSAPLLANLVGIFVVMAILLFFVRELNLEEKS